MVMMVDQQTPSLLPPHLRRTGRIESLHEFQQRAISYHENRDQQRRAPDKWDETAQEVDRVDTRTEELRRQARSRRSSRSLFGDRQRTTKSIGSLYAPQAKVVGFLVLLGVIGGPLSFGIRLAYDHINSLRVSFSHLGTTSLSQYTLWTAHTIAFTLAALLFTRLSPAASGSGVSQMKSILTGIDPRVYLPSYFAPVTLVAKVGGLICSVGAGLVVGTEGAFVHIMSIVTHLLLQLPPFVAFSERLTFRLQLLAAACSVGVASTFSSPIGGVTFSMEVTATYYLISNYMKAFISSVSGAVILHLTLVLAESSSRERQAAIMEVELPESPFEMWELPWFVLLGMTVGALSSLMIALLCRVAHVFADDYERVPVVECSS